MNCPHRPVSQLIIGGPADDQCPTCLMVDELIDQLIRKQMREDPPPNMALPVEPEFRVE
jgi:hypothetical protein